MDKRCKNCEFWEDDTFEHLGILYPKCTSTAVFYDCHFPHILTPKSSFGCIQWQEKEPDLREQLAAYAHDAWSGWMEYLFDKSPVKPAGIAIIPTIYVENWWRQMRTDYTNLSEEEKESDCAEADKMIAIFEKYQKGKENG